MRYGIQLGPDVETDIGVVVADRMSTRDNGFLDFWKEHPMGLDEVHVISYAPHAWWAVWPNA